MNNFENSDESRRLINQRDELKDAPKLSSLEKKDSFSVPDGYFDNLPDQVMNKIAANPLLNTENPFIVPDFYFEKLANDISNKTVTERSNGRIITLLRPQYSLSLAAACLALFFFIRMVEKPLLMNVSQETAENAVISDSDLVGL